MPTRAQAREQATRDREGAKAIAERARQAEAAELAQLDAELELELLAIREGAGAA